MATLVKEKEEVLEGLQQKLSQGKKSEEIKVKEISKERMTELFQEVDAFIKEYRFKEIYNFEEALKEAMQKYGDEFGAFCDGVMIKSAEIINYPYTKIDRDLNTGRRINLSNFVCEIYNLDAKNKFEFLSKWAKYLTADKIYELAKKSPKDIFGFIEVLISNLDSKNSADFAEAALLMSENIEGAPVDILAEIVANFGSLKECERMAKVLNIPAYEFEEKYIFRTKDYLGPALEIEEFKYPPLNI